MIKILVILALTRLLCATNAPFFCSGIYTACVLVFGLISHVKPLDLLVQTAIAFALASLYFWLLNRFEEKPILFWGIAVLGALIGLI